MHLARASWYVVISVKQRPLAACIKRAAMLTQSPIIVYSFRLEPPTTPQKAVSVVMPIDDRTPTACSSSRMSRAARTARVEYDEKN